MPERLVAQDTMRATIPGALALIAVAACADLYDADPAHTARADSSAAGYSVGEVPAGQGIGVSVAGRVAAHESANPAETPSASAGVAVPVATGRGDPNAGTARGPVAVEAATARPAGGSADTSTGDRAVSGGADSVGRVSGSTRDDVTIPESLTPLPVDSVVVNTFLAFDPRARVVWLDLIAGYDGSNGSLNFDGGSHGSHTLRVPLGWRVEARFANQDNDLAHSAVVIREVDPIPLIAPPAAFPGAFTLSLEEGLQQGDRDTMRFSTDTPGRYRIVCAVPGHAQGGMWIGLETGGRIAAPEFVRK